MHPSMQSFVISFLSAAMLVAGSNEMTIGAFNIQIFGDAKSKKADVLEVLADIVTNFDVIAVQEIRDSSGEAMPRLMERVHTRDTRYRYVISDRLGRSVSKEQYAFVYRTNIVQCSGASVYRDTNDVYERPPYIGHFAAGIFTFTLIIVHTKPTDAEREIDGLIRVIAGTTRHATNKDIIVLGDLNADGTYFSEKTTTGIRDERFCWSITDDMDTTIAESERTYDRIIFLKKYTVEDWSGKAGVFRFDIIYRLAMPAKEVSDHFPVWARFFTDKDTD